ncbi:MAG: LysR family transcriptional regulator [Alphaproteobacteria bacterium]|nr:LysR family transcriptional regulator [Alphaproteobacteria bacterium]
MRSLNLDQLRTLVEVVALGNFSAAGRNLNLTQPAISLHVRELEQRFGVRLVERVGKQAHPTAPGRDLVEHAERVLRACDDIDASMRRFREGWLGRVHIGTTLTALTYELPPILRKIRMEYPGIDLLVTNMPTRDSVQNVVQNAIDIALVTLPIKEPRLRVTPLRPEMLVAILPAGTKDIPDVITPAYAAQQLLVMEHGRGAVHALVMRWLAGQMPLVRRPMLIGTVEAMKTVVSLGLGMSIVPDVAVAEPTANIIVRPLKPPVPCTLGLIERRDKPGDPALDIVRAALLELRQEDRSNPRKPRTLRRAR